MSAYSPYGISSSSPVINVGSTRLSGLDDVGISSATNGQALVYNSTTGLWTNGTVSGGGGGVTTLAALTDVNLSSPDNLSYLKYDTTTSRWINNNPFGNLRITNNNDIGTATDADLMTLTDNLVTVRGQLNFNNNSDYTLQNLGVGQLTILTNANKQTIFKMGSNDVNSGITFKNLANEDIMRVAGDKSVKFQASVVSFGPSDQFTMSRVGATTQVNNSGGPYQLYNQNSTSTISFRLGSSNTSTSLDIRDVTDTNLIRFRGDGSIVGLPLSKISDASITSPTNGQVLTWNNSTSRWVNTTLSSSTGDIVFTGADIGIAADTDVMTIESNKLTVRKSLEVVNPSLTVGGLISLTHDAGEAVVANTKGDMSISNTETGKDINIRANAINLRNDANSIIARMHNSHLNLPQGFYQSFGDGTAGPLQIVRDLNLSQISSNANRLLILNSASGQNTDIKGSNIRFLDLSDVVKLQTSLAGMNMAQDQVLGFGVSDLLQISRKASKSQILNTLNDLELQNTATNGHIIAKLGTSSNTTSFKIRTDLNSDVFEFRADGTTNMNLDTLNDVTITSATNGQVLSFNSTSGHWVNATAGGTGSWTINSSGLCTSTNSIDFRHSNFRIMDQNGISCIEMNGTSGMRIPNTKLLGFGPNDEFGMHFTGSEGYIRVNSGVLRLRSGGSQMICETNQLVGQMSSGGNIFFAARREDASFILHNPGQQVFSISVNNGATPITALTIQNDTGNVNIPNLTSSSDDRDKVDEIQCDLGLSFINQLIPTKYKFDRRADYEDGIPDGSKKDPLWDYGLIAQQLQVVAPINTKFVQASGPDKLSVGYLQLIAPMIKAIQQLSAKVSILEAQVASLRQ